MSERKIITKVLCWLILIVLPSFAAALDLEYKDYTIKKGDTLWDISNAELKDPFLWPKVWKENPDIKNPDKIYPGQKIRIPLYLLQKEVVPVIKPLAKIAIKPEIPKEKPAEKRIEPKKREYLVNKHVLTSSGYITEKIHSVGAIIDTAPGRTVLGKDDQAYIKVNRPVKKGDKFYVIVPIEEVKHPKTGQFLGYLVDIRGTVEVIGQEPNDDPLVLVTNAYYDIYTGNLLDDYYEIEPPLAPENPRKPNIDGYIVASKHLHLISIPYDIAYIDKGKKDGLQVGDLLATKMQSKHVIYNGLIQIINTKDTTSTVIIRKSTDSITKGDGVTGVKQE